MANQSFSYVHPCDSSFTFSNKMLNDERNDSGLNYLNIENQQATRNQPHHLLFNEPVNLYEYEHILPKDAKHAPTSRSVPSSRRNSNEKDANQAPLDALFNTKLQLGTTTKATTTATSSIPEQTVLFHNDVRFGKTTQRPSLPSDTTVSNNGDSQSEYITDALSFGFEHDNSATPLFQQQSPHLSQNYPVYQHQPSTFVPPNDYGDLFSMQKTPTRHNKSLESLRSKSWTQYLDRPTTNGAALHHVMTNGSVDSFDDFQPTTRINYAPNTTTTPTSTTGFYHPTAPRRSSYGWQNTESIRYQDFPSDLAGIKSRLTSSQSHSDLRASSAAEQHIGSAAASFGFYNGSSSITGLNDNNDLPPLCQQYIQYGYCSLADQCHFLHPAISSNYTGSSSPRSQHRSPSVHPALYPSYPMNALLNSSASILTNPSMTGASTTTLPIFPVGASSSVYGRSSGILPFNPGSPQHPQQLYKQDHPQHPQHHLSLHHLQQRQQQQHQQQQQQQQLQQHQMQQLEQQQQQQMQHQQQLQQLRRPSTDQDTNRFVNASLDDYQGQLYELAKDQNGCRFLQRKIEDSSQNNKQAITAIYNEIHSHFVELMTNSFGNYLCQKLLERCDNEQRDTIVEIVAPDIVDISLNMHGTRAVQKLIEFLSTSEQIQMITSALNPSVVPLIKDLNGNHVIQKCLHRLSAEHRQFIYDAVSANCVEVATHKHGCCVLQRCIDYSSNAQKVQLVEEITRHALPLVQDPYGNYVVQYVLELGDAKFSDGLIRRFVGHTCHLSAQKFSSNVIEKCIRVASTETRRLLIAEFIDPVAMDKLVRDSFANYVIQTSLDYAEADQRAELVECIRPVLSSVRTTPHGKRIHGKIFRDQHRSNSQPTTQQKQQQLQMQMQQTLQQHQQQQQQTKRRSLNPSNHSATV